jgi:hypothetical protein
MPDPDDHDPPSRDHAGAPGPGNRRAGDPVVIIAVVVALVVLVVVLLVL